MSTIVTPEITDDSRVVGDTGLFEEIKTALIESARKVVAKAKSATAAYKNHAELEMSLASMCFRPNGFPDWARSTGVYKVNAEDAVDALFQKLDASTRNSAKSAIRQHVNRTFREKAIIAYLRATDPDLSQVTDESTDDKPVYVVGDDDELFKNRVREQYESQVNEKGEPLLTVPAKYAHKPPADSGTGGGPGSGTPTGFTTIRTNMSALTSGGVAGDMAVLGLLEGLTTLSETLLKKDARYGGGGVESVRQNLRRIGEVALLTSKSLDESGLDDEEEKRLKAAKFSSKDEKLVSSK